jgi:hypothetical protein
MTEWLYKFPHKVTLNYTATCFYSYIHFNVNWLLRYLTLFQLALSVLWLAEEENDAYKHISFDVHSLTSCELFAECNCCISQGVPVDLQAVCGLHNMWLNMNSVLGNRFLLIINIINTEIIKYILICVSYEKTDRTL